MVFLSPKPVWFHIHTGFFEENIELHTWNVIDLCQIILDGVLHMTTKPQKVTKFFHLLRNVMLIIGCLYIAFFAVLICLSDDTDQLGGWCEEYPGTWVAVLPDGTATDITLPVDIGLGIGQPVSYTTVLPDSFPSDTVITIRIGRPVTVSIDGVKRYEFTEDYFPLPGGSVKVHLALLALTPEDAGKDLTLLYDNPNEDNGSMAEIYWGNSFGIWKHLDRKSVV